MSSENNVTLITLLKDNLKYLKHFLTTNKIAWQLDAQGCCVSVHHTEEYLQHLCNAVSISNCPLTRKTI